MIIKKKPVILMVEQDEEDTVLTQAVFEEKKYDAEIHILSQAEEAMAWLNFAESSSILPSLILINVKLVPAGGIDLCRSLKNGKFSYIPVVILGDSSYPPLVKKCYEAGANSFIQKPSLSDPTYAAIDDFMRYWFGTATLPV